MREVSVFLLVTLGLALAACSPTASMTSAMTAQPAATATPLRPVAANRTSMEATDVPAAFDVVQTVTGLAPGAFSVMQTHGGHGYLTVLEGEVTLRSVGGAETEVKAGATALLKAGEFAQVGNLGSTRAQYVTAVVLPKGAALTTQQDLAALAPTGQTTISSNMFAVSRPTVPFDVVQFTLSFAPGALTPMHIHGGEAYVTVLEGEITFTTGGGTLVHKTGDSFIERVNEVGQARNVGSVPAKVTATFLLPKGAELTTNR